MPGIIDESLSTEGERIFLIVKISSMCESSENSDKYLGNQARIKTSLKRTVNSNLNAIYLENTVHFDIPRAERSMKEFPISAS